MVDIITKDGMKAQVAMRVYGINPWGDIEVLYVGFEMDRASTNSPHEATGASMCSFETSKCYFNESKAIAEACTYVEDECGFMNPRDN